MLWGGTKLVNSIQFGSWNGQNDTDPRSQIWPTSILWPFRWLSRGRAPKHVEINWDVVWICFWPRPDRWLFLSCKQVNGLIWYAYRRIGLHQNEDLQQSWILVNKFTLKLGCQTKLSSKTSNIASWMTIYWPQRSFAFCRIGLHKSWRTNGASNLLAFRVGP